MICLLSTTIFAQEQPLSAYKNLIGKTWIIEGKWGDGTLYKKESTFEFGLNKTIVIEKSLGFTDSLQTTFGERNYGIRQFNPQDSTITFHEFDVFGGLTTGQVIIEGKNIGYVYEYQGYNLIDLWTYIDESNYRMIVSTFENGEIGSQNLMEGNATTKN